MARIELSETSTSLKTKNAWQNVFLDIKQDPTDGKKDSIYVLDERRGIKQIVNFKTGSRKKRANIICKYIVYDILYGSTDLRVQILTI